jgi:hypothetical protein
MSLINDALRQARQAQPANPAPANGPPLTPVEPVHRPGGSTLALPMIIAVVLAVAVALLWIYFRTGSDVLMVRASSHPQTSVEVARPQPPAPSLAAIPATTPAATPTPVPPVNAVATNTNAPANEPAANVPAVAEPPKALPPVYRLQSIFFRAKNPSAVINGKTLFLGSRVGDARIVAIDQESATIVTSAGQTNVLLLSD